MNGERRPFNWGALAGVTVAITVVGVIFSAGSRVSKLESSVETLIALNLDARLVKVEALTDEQGRSLLRMYERLIEIERRQRNGNPQ